MRGLYPVETVSTVGKICAEVSSVYPRSGCFFVSTILRSFVEPHILSIEFSLSYVNVQPIYQSQFIGFSSVYIRV